MGDICLRHEILHFHSVSFLLVIGPIGSAMRPGYLSGYIVLLVSEYATSRRRFNFHDYTITWPKTRSRCLTLILSFVFCVWSRDFRTTQFIVSCYTHFGHFPVYPRPAAYACPAQAPAQFPSLLSRVCWVSSRYSTPGFLDIMKNHAPHCPFEFRVIDCRMPERLAFSEILTFLQLFTSPASSRRHECGPIA